MELKNWVLQARNRLVITSQRKCETTKQDFKKKGTRRRQRGPNLPLFTVRELKHLEQGDAVVELPEL